jgi:hypothetical protein
VQKEKKIKFFAGCKSLPGAGLSAKTFFAECISLPRARHSAKRSLPSVLLCRERRSAKSLFAECLIKHYGRAPLCRALAAHGKPQYTHGKRFAVRFSSRRKSPHGSNLHGKAALPCTFYRAHRKRLCRASKSTHGKKKTLANGSGVNSG